MDKWLLSKLNSVVKAVDGHLGNYRIPEAARALQEFVDDMSNWYVRRSRERFWAKGMEQDKINAYMTLYTALVTICKASAPMIPFMTEEIYQNLVKSIDEEAPESIHLCGFPEVCEAYIDKELEKDMDLVLAVVVLGRACRNTANIKNRQPIGQMYIKSNFELPEFFRDIIADELNVKHVEFVKDISSFISYTFKPNFQTLKLKYPKKLGVLKNLLADIDGHAAMASLKKDGYIVVNADGTDCELLEEDLLIEAAHTEGYVSDTERDVTVVLDTKLTPELLEEGFVREIISKVQTMRKEAGFEVMDHICISMAGNDKVAQVVKSNETVIRSEVMADNVVYDHVEGYTKEWNINGEKVTLGVMRIG